MSVVFSSLCFIVTIMIIGDTVNQLLFKNGFTKSIPLRLSLAYGLGTGVFSFIMFYLLYAGLRLNNFSIFLATVFFIGAFVFQKRRLLSGWRIPKSSLPTSLKLNSIWDGFFIFIIVISLLLIFFKALFLPMHLADDRAQWGAKAKIIYYEKTIYAESFKDSQRLQLHTRYPFLIPILEASLFSFMKKADDRQVRIIFPLYFTALLFFMYSAQRRYASQRHALLFTAMLSVIPVFLQDVFGNPSSGYADIPLAFYYTVSVASIFNWFKSKHLKDFILAIVFTSFAIFTKQEGLVLFLVTIFVLGVKILFGDREDLTNKYKYLLMFMVMPLVPLIPWFLFRSTLILPEWEKDWNISLFSFDYVMSRFHRLPRIFASLADVLFSAKYWNVLWIMFFGVIALFLKTSFRFPLLFILLLIFVNLSALCAAIFFYPWVWWPNFLFDMPRLLIIYIPLVVFFISYAVSREIPVAKNMSL